MKIAAFVLLFIGMPLSIFGYWGSQTVAGRKKYDEMDGIIPIFSLYLGVVLVIIGLIVGLWWLSLEETGAPPTDPEKIESD